MIDEHMAQLFTLQADICKTLADPTRLMILHEITKEEMSVGQLIANLGLPQSNVSRHLAVLRERDLVNTRREGTTIYYSLANPKIAQACDIVREVLEGNLMKNQSLVDSLDLMKKA
jgi:DNA-binding transcriptional ArsR family regulator